MARAPLRPGARSAARCSGPVDGRRASRHDVAAREGSLVGGGHAAVPEPKSGGRVASGSEWAPGGVSARGSLPFAAFHAAGDDSGTITWWRVLASPSYPKAMARVTARTKLTELRALVGSASTRGQDGPARLVRSVQQSLRVEGYEVREEVLRSALQRATAGRAH
jgi:hypothetical protein